MNRFCFTLIGCAGLAAQCLYAADPAPAAPRVKSVIRTDPQTGKLVRRVIVAAQPAAVSSAAQAPAAVAPKSPVTPAIKSMVESAAARQSLPPELLHSVIQVESNYNPNAVSPKGAQGLMQLIPDTARRFGVNNAFDPVENIEGGARYLKYLLDMYKGDYSRALAAYNAGEGAVAKYDGIPPYRETVNYVAQVSKRFDAAAKAAVPAPVAPVAAAPAAPAADAPKQIEQVIEADGSVRYVSK